MKKLIVLLLVVCMTTGLLAACGGQAEAYTNAADTLSPFANVSHSGGIQATPLSNVTADGEAALGDVNGDNAVNHLDAMLVAQVYVGAASAEDLDLDAADVNGDGQVSHLDAMLIAQFYTGVISVFPALDPWGAYDVISLAEAIAICEQTGETQTTEKYYIVGTVTEVWNDTYGNMNISDGTNTIKIYGSYSADGSTRYDAMENKPVAGDTVLLYGPLVNYKGNTPEMVDAWIIDYRQGEAPETQMPEFDSTLTVAELLALPLQSGETTEGRYYVTATIDSITNAEYGAMYISDETGTISVYNSANSDGTVGYKSMEEKPYKGDLVTLYVTVQNYYGSFEIKSAWIISWETAQDDFNEADYTEMTIAEARNAAVDTKVKVSGVVAQITYANGYIPSGVILVDDTSSIYVYDRDLAGRVSVGNTITVAASKTYWILETELESAEKYGYQGCNQLEAAYLLENDEGSHDFDKSWITECTVKEVMDTPITTDITSTIFKVTALVSRVEGSGFTNYYINDLDGVTGSYCYSQCNGGDFSWLDEFDGKICTVYLMALNAKSSASGCFWRFLPIEVIDEGFDISTVNIAQHVVKYYGVGQFLSIYTGDPELELITSVSSELLNFADAQLSYSSSNTDVVYFDDNVMHCGSTGTATVTVSCTWDGVTYSEDVVITVEMNDEVAYITVEEAINAAVGETVTVKGIVGPSLVNRDGFYLIDETGIVAITTSTANLELLEIGQEVVLTGTRDLFHNGTGDHAGQTAITGCEITANYYGNHEYCDDFFVHGKTVADFYALDVTVDYSTTVFVLMAYVEVQETAYYTNIKLTDGNGSSISLYCSSAAQYKWLQAYAGQEVTLEIAPCNWNNKTYWTGCVLAVVLEDGTKVVNSLNFN